MARKKPAKKATKKAAPKKSAKKATKKPAVKSSKKPAKKAKKAAKPARRPVAKKAAKPAPKKVAARKAPASAKATAGKPNKSKPQKAAASKPAARSSAASQPGKKPNLDRPRKTVADIHGIPSSLDMNRTASAAKSGRAEMQDKLSKNTGAGAALTAGDVDADWQSAEAIGDEAPGGDNPTPDQDVVDDIGRALGVEYDDDEELQGGAEIADRDRHRWELDPSSKDDFDEE
ncbi:MAG TPA: DUF6335 family protein [Vicinamibacterales bacterium]|nr:DUF6335 family protein [Vicinamibacterales bacterium]